MLSDDAYTELIDFLSRKFGDLDRRITGLEERITGLEHRMTSLETRMTRVELEMEAVRHDLRGIAEGVLQNGTRLDAHEGRFDRLERKLDHQTLLLTGEIQGLAVRVAALEA